MKIYKIGEFAKLIGVGTQTLRNWDNNDILKPYKVTEGGTRFYSEQQYLEYIGKYSNNSKRIVVGYCRVSSRSQSKELKNQSKLMEKYLISQGVQFTIIEDIGSGINYNRKGLNKLLEMIVNEEVSKIVVLYKDRLVRFGFELIETIANMFNVDIEIVNQTNKSYEEELTEDFEDLIQIITVFSNRLYRKRSYKNKKTNEYIEVLKDDIKQKS